MKISFSVCSILAVFAPLAWGAVIHHQKRAEPGKIVSVASSSSFCLLLPAQPGISIGDSEGNARSFCYGSGNSDGSGRIPSEAIISAHVETTSTYIQVTGKINTNLLQISSADGGGQYDDASWGIEPNSGCQNYDRYVELVETSDDIGTFCIRCCKYDDVASADYDKHAPCYAGNDEAGCEANIPGNYGDGFSDQ